MAKSLPDTVLGHRDRVVLLLGFLGAFRRSELVALDANDLERSADGLIAHVRRSKTDQEGIGRRVAIPNGTSEATCGVRAVESWLAVSGIHAGPLVRPVDRHGHVSPKRLSPKAVGLVIKRHIERIGCDPSQYAGHSLRAGFATEAAAAGASERSIMAQTGHRSVTTVRQYIRDGRLFRDHAALALGL
jgi:integrase